LNGSLVEWQTKQLATVIASTVPVSKGKKNPLTPLVEAIQLWSSEDEPARKEPQPGSTERFLGQFGPAMDRR
jgi:hypothetical protein